MPPIPLQQIDLTKLFGPPVLPVGEPAPAAGTAAPSFTDGGFLDGPGRFGTFQDNTPLEAAAPPSSDAGAPAEPAVHGGFSGYGPAILGLPPILRSLVGLGSDPLDGQSSAAAVLNLAGNLAVGAAEGVVNLVPKTAVSLINTIYEGSRLEALGEGGHLTQDELDQIRATKAIDSTGTIVTPANPVQALGETFGEFAAPLFLGGAVRSLGRLAVEGTDALLGSLTELNAAKATAKIEPELIAATEPLTVAPNSEARSLVTSEGQANSAQYAQVKEYYASQYPDYVPYSVGSTDANARAAWQVADVTAPIDFDHVIGADFNAKGLPTGGHSLEYGDVQIVPGTESPPNAVGVYEGQIQVADPENPGQWITKTSNGGVNTMFPADWTADRITVELDGAWNDPNNFVITGNRWNSITPSGVSVQGYLFPRITAYPLY
ncbi:MAG: EndoU domain-containing protein [Aliidongia sp.]